MARGSGDSSNYFRPRTIRKPVTNDWVALNVPSAVRRIEFRAFGGQIGIRVNNSGSNFIDLSPGDYPFSVTLDDDMIIEVRGQNGGEILSCYVS